MFQTTTWKQDIFYIVGKNEQKHYFEEFWIKVPSTYTLHHRGKKELERNATEWIEWHLCGNPIKLHKWMHENELKHAYISYSFLYFLSTWMEFGWKEKFTLHIWIFCAQSAFEINYKMCAVSKLCCGGEQQQ